jgi:hypothetical protein
MCGHPNPFRDSKEVIPMDDKGLLEPSFAEAIAAIEQSLELPPPRRTHWACSLRQIAKARGRLARAAAERRKASAPRKCAQLRPKASTGGDACSAVSGWMRLSALRSLFCPGSESIFEAWW